MEGARFATSDAKTEQLRRRWGILQHENRWGQLAWEAQRIRCQEPDFSLARHAHYVALMKMGCSQDACKVAEAGMQRSPRNEAWQDLRRQAANQAAPSSDPSRSCTAQLPSTMSAVHAKRTPVVVASLFCGEQFSAAMRPARENHARWCALHGYRYACFFENLANRPDPTWSKIPIVQQLFDQGAEYVFWMDADSLFIHDGVDLQWACDLDRDFVFAGDLNVVFNAGHFLARNRPWTRKFLSDAFQVYPWPQWEDNGAMMVVLGGGNATNPLSWQPAFDRMKVPTRSQQECEHAMVHLIPRSIADHVSVVPQHRLNSYEWPGGGGHAALLRGDPVLHFAGCSAKEKVALVERFAGCTGDPSDILGTAHA